MAMKLPRVRLQILFSAVMLALVFAAQAMSLLAPLDRFLADKRFHFANRPASGEIVFVAIDKKSLDAVGVWPWPRSIHGEITDRLRQLGAHDIVFDIDFSTPSTPENDAAFAAAIERAGGAVTLPTFLQHGDAALQQNNAQLTVPIDALAQNAWLASVNVFPDADSKVRQFPMGLQFGPTFIASIPATIVGGDPGHSDAITIDFGIDISSFETFSAVDLLDGTVDRAAIEGRTVVIGAFATELRDFYAVPKLDIIPGPVLQGIAAETLLADRNLQRIDPMAVALPVFAVLIAMLFGLRRQTSLQTIATFGSIPLAGETLAVALYLGQGLIVPTAFLHVSALTALGVRLFMMTELSRLLSREARTDARNMRQVLQHVVRENFDAIIVTDEDGRALQISEAVRDVFELGGALPEHGTPAAEFLPRVLSRNLEMAIADARAGERHQTEIRTFTFPVADGTRRSVEYTIGISELRMTSKYAYRAGKMPEQPIVACLTARDITERLSFQETLQRYSDMDDMTGAWRRHAFVQFMNSKFDEHGCGGFAIVAFNLHRFKTVNIALGRDTGNAVLRSVAERLRNTDDHIHGTARLGGDTFAVLLGNIYDEADARVAAERIVDIIAAPYPVERGHAQIGVQAGVTLCGDTRGEPTDAETLLDRAEMALDEARRSSGSQIVFHDKALAGQRMRSRIIERDLWHALDRGEIHVAYQLQVSLADHVPCGAEALVRWSHPDLGNVGPDEFVPIAEANGLITKLGSWILYSACREAAKWPDELSVSVNVAPQQFARDDIVDEVRSALTESGLQPDRLTIELVESELLETDQAVLDRILALKALGVSIALDDFGTGYSGIGYLSRLRFDKIKIDKQFIDDLTTNVETQGIIRSVAVLGDAFDMTIVCEGVETREQEAFLRLIGCDEGQGYLYAKPVDGTSFRILLDHLGLNDKTTEAVTA